MYRLNAEGLSAGDRPPIAVALSGGSDSLALLHLAKAWADRAGRQLIALTVDHGLQAGSAAWSRFAAKRAGRLGIRHSTVAWLGDKPSTGLPAAARAARHALLADAARSAGARVVLLAHTADDLMEAETMRRMGASTPSPRQWSPSPAWPQGRGVFLLRPLLGHRRAELRSWLAGVGETWIDDPANDDPRNSRTMARRRLSDCPVAARPSAELAPPMDWEGIVQGAGGEFVLPRALVGGQGVEQWRLIGVLALCAAGTARPPAASALGRVAARMTGADFAASLAGARIEARGGQVMVCREPGEQRRGGLRPAPLPLGPSIFDGRFLIEARQPGHSVAPLRGLAAQLPRLERERLKAIPAAVRGALPAIISPSDQVFCPVLAVNDAVSARSLGLARLHAALGITADERGAAAT